ncbi:hypothetical protein R1sor_024635 [Riccia sorocarpa]|uniref:Uncharacterized protein n=1 Tax=Riccia sorocarpa TaxID=122646 RepID=A0ABD3GX44_9MARC
MSPTTFAMYWNRCTSVDEAAGRVFESIEIDSQRRRVDEIAYEQPSFRIVRGKLKSASDKIQGTEGEQGTGAVVYLQGASLLRPSLTDDPVNELFWVHIDRAEITRLTSGVPPEIVSRLGLDNFLALEFQPPNIPAVVEFISNYDAEHHRSTVRGREVDLTLENIRNALRLPVGRSMCPRLKQKQHVADWYSKEVRGVLIWYVKTKVDPDGNPDHEDLDWASIVRKDWESEISFLQNHWWTDKYEGKSRTCFGQTMTQFLMHMGIIQPGEPADGALAVVVPEEEESSNHISDGDTEMLEQRGSEGTGGWDTSDFDTLDVGLGRRTLENTSSTGRAQTHEAGPSSSYQRVRADARPPAVPRREHEPTTSAEWMQFIRQIFAARPEKTEELEQTASGTDTGGGSSTGRGWQQTDEGEDDDDDVGQTGVRSPDFDGTVDPNRSKGKTVDIPSRSSPGTCVHIPEAGEGSAFDLGLLHWEAATILADISRAETVAEKRKRIVESSESDMDSPKRHKLKEYITSPVRNIISVPERVLSIDVQAGNLAVNRTSREAETEAPAERTREDRGKRPVDESEVHPEVDSSRKNSLQLEQSMMENMEKLRETLVFLMKQEENPEKLIQTLDSLMKTKGTDGLAEILKEALDFLMKHKGHEGLEDNLGTGVDSGKDAGASDEQRHASSEGTPQPGPSAGTAENFAEAARNYCARLQAAEREFREHFNRNVLPWAEAMITGVHMCELDLHAAYRQTQMIHKERWVEFARYGLAYFAMRSIPTPDLERMILENRAEEYIKGFQFYDPLPCDNYDHGHLCDHGCVRIDCHICRVCAPAAATARQEKQVYKRAGLDQKGEEIFRCWNFGVREERDLRDPLDLSLRYRPNIWKPPVAMGGGASEDGGDGMSAREDYIVPDGVERAGPVVSDGTEHLTPEEQNSGGTEPMAQDSGGTEPMDQDSGSSEHLSTGDAGCGDTTVMTPVGSASPATEIMMPDDVSVRTASLTPETVRLTPEEEQSTPMAAGDPNTTRITPTGEGSSRIIKKPYFTGKATTGIVLPDLNKFQEEICTGDDYSHRINLANYDIEGKSDEQIRISVAELLTEVEREVRQAGSVYFRILMKIFVGTAGVVSRYNEAVGWIGKRYTELQKRCTDLSNTEHRLLQDLDALRPTVDALKYLRHKQKG